MIKRNGINLTILLWNGNNDKDKFLSIFDLINNCITGGRQNIVCNSRVIAFGLFRILFYLFLAIIIGSNISYYFTYISVTTCIHTKTIYFKK